MNSLLELNGYSATAIEVVDSRLSDVVFDRSIWFDQVLNITSTSFFVPVPINVLEVINYQTANCRLQIAIRSTNPAFYTGSTVTWASLPAGVTVVEDQGVYTVSGINSSTIWNQIKTVSWTLPSDYESEITFFLEYKVLWFDQQLGRETSINWAAYDPDYYYVAELDAVTELQLEPKVIKDFSSNMASTFTLVDTQLLNAQFLLTCTAKVIRRSAVTLASTATLTLPKADTLLQLVYTTTAANQTISFTVLGASNVKIFWGDGTSSNLAVPVTTSNTYAAAGTYKVTILGAYTGFDGLRDLKLRRVLSFPDTGFQKLTGIGVNLLEIPASIPSSLTDLSGCFESVLTDTTTHFNLNITSWNTGNVTNMSTMFRNNKVFNQAIGTWNVGNVTNMNAMFSGATAFNQPIGNWNVGNVTLPTEMFFNATGFNQALNTWNTGSFNNTNSMFSGATAFNQPLNNWNMTNVTNMQNMFKGATAFNQNLNSWNTGNVTNMISVFENAEVFNGAIGNWNVSNVTNMQLMFGRTVGGNITAFNQPIGSWNVSNVTNMQQMFINNSSFNQPLDTWNVGNVTNMQGMFSSGIYDQPLSTWNVGNVTNMISMFAFSQFNKPINTWNVSNVTDMFQMFSTAQFNQSLDQWQLIKVTRTEGMFRQNRAFNQPLNNWNVGSVTNMSGMFQGSVYNQSLNSWNVSNVTNMQSMFGIISGFTSSFNQPLNNWNTGNVTNMIRMFESNAVFDQNISGWCVSAIPTKPLSFDSNTNSNWITAEKPVWGTCP
jgi:surface protein